jgi:glycosyltransferase involved in cell wall biosynthesis
LAHCNLPHADFWMVIQKIFFWHKLKLVSVKHGFDELLLAKHPGELHKLRNSFFAWAQRLTGIFVRKNVAISRFIYDLYIKGKISKKSKTTVIYNGIDTTPRDSSGYERKIANPYAVIVGRLVKYKGHEYLIEAWRMVKERDPSLRLAVLGKGVYQEELLQKVKEYGLEEQIIFTGHQDPHPFFHFSRFSIVSSLCEPFGLITLESWLHKKPVVAFDVPAINEVIENNINGILVEPFNTNELANKIMYMFEHTEACSKMGEKGYEKSLQEYNLQKMTAQYMSVYNEVIKR